MIYRMKKRLASIFVAVIMAVCACFVYCVPCFAADYVGSIETTAKSLVIEVTVNNVESVHGSYETVHNPRYEVVVDFVYSGDEPLKYWEVPGLVEGVDYVIISDEGEKIKIGILKPEIDYIWANAITGNNTKTPVKPDKIDTNHKSPDTGVCTTGIVSALGVGAVALAARRKK